MISILTSLRCSQLRVSTCFTLHLAPQCGLLSIKGPTNVVFWFFISPKKAFLLAFSNTDFFQTFMRITRNGRRDMINLGLAHDTVNGPLYIRQHMCGINLIGQ